MAKKIFSNLKDKRLPGEWIKIKQNVFSTSLKDDLAAFKENRDDETDIAVFRGASFHQYEISSSITSAAGTYESDKYVPKSYYVQRMQSKGLRAEAHLAFREIARSSDERTMIAALIPMVGTDDTATIVDPEGEVEQELALLANMNSVVLDYCCGFKVSGTHIRKHTFNQLPFLPPEAYKEADYEFIVTRVCALSCACKELESFAKSTCYFSPFENDEQKRSVIKAELDAYYAHLYGLGRTDLKYILDPSSVMGDGYPSEPFRVLKNNDLREFGEYRTQRLVLEAWDRLFGS